eukprot:TRINITY_DN10249_c0_g3_i5.p1 TRINITY_DN10249_c0_g3~~TRINITY_DN10249_c0_g3_i5.p1  ORF type:complete len:438 (+),score=78.16 TRINITY_DN10249_c0_g3_i5:84-1397(+)
MSGSSIVKARSAVVDLEESVGLLSSDVDFTDDEEETPTMNGNSSATPLLRASISSATVVQQHDPAFSVLVASVEAAIDEGIQPELITQGSSGSYFCRNTDNAIVGVFKPKDEEPYGELNPKWGKWVQRNFCCCMYGRDCLLRNAGYLSEAGASLVDRCLELNVVPKTKVVRLTSPAFFYSRLARARARAVRSASERFPETIGRHLRQGLPPKTGSLQTFVKEYKDASVFLKQYPMDQLPAAIQHKLKLQFDRLVVLDYITRNTDRGNDNWLIRYQPPDEERRFPGDITIAAIDNGLSFPFKHPDNWRTYPYHWAWLPLAQMPFSQETIDHVLPLISDDDWVENLGDELYVLFSMDKHFKRKKFRQQMAVMRGQILNLRKAMQQRLSPAQLVQLRTGLSDCMVCVCERERGMHMCVCSECACSHRCAAPDRSRAIANL